jgi:hypothetical protein
MIRAGILTDDDPVELLEGWLVPKMPKNPPHRITTRLTREALVGILPTGWYVDTQEPITTADSEPEPDVVVVAELSPEVRAFIDHNEAWQKGQRATVDTKGVWTNYRLLQVWDLLGLYFCCQEPYEDHVAPVPIGYTGGEDDGVPMTMTPAGSRRVAFDPYPFDVRPCRVQLAFRRVARSSFDDTEAFRREWFGAEVGLLEFELV